MRTTRRVSCGERAGLRLATTDGKLAAAVDGDEDFGKDTADVLARRQVHLRVVPRTYLAPEVSTEVEACMVIDLGKSIGS